MTPPVWKPRPSCVEALALPVAVTLDRTTPFCTVAVVVTALGAPGPPTAW